MADETVRRWAPEQDEPPVTDLIREVLGDTRELVRIEVALARDELGHEVASARTGAIALACATAVAVAAFTMFMVAIVLALRAGWVGALVVAGTMLAAALGLGLLGWSALPTKPLEQTKGRLQANVERLKERMA
jgi:Putative Actinobacterial Holin-X, holin superfamily III